MGRDRVPRVDERLRRLIDSADFVIGNCEAPVTRAHLSPTASYRFRFEMAAEYLHALLEGLGMRPGRCALSVANNHIGDQGPRGLRETLERLWGLGVIPLGARTADGLTAQVEVRGVKLAIVAWTHWMNQEVFEGDDGVGRVEEVDGIPGRAWSEAKERLGADCLIGTPHWDYEFCHFPAQSTRALAGRMIERGFDLIVGHHPHVLQPIEWLAGGICMYSVGNANGPRSLLLRRYSKLFGAFEIELVPTGPSRGRVAAYRLHPFVQRAHGATVYLTPLDALPRDLRTKLEARLRLLYPPSGHSLQTV
jgi:poly-gamma-glutamate synthesis protein (capsule biosynthesis protein)